MALNHRLRRPQLDHGRLLSNVNRETFSFSPLCQIWCELSLNDCRADFYPSHVFQRELAADQEIHMLDVKAKSTNQEALRSSVQRQASSDISLCFFMSSHIFCDDCRVFFFVNRIILIQWNLNHSAFRRGLKACCGSRS